MKRITIENQIERNRRATRRATVRTYARVHYRKRDNFPRSFASIVRRRRRRRRRPHARSTVLLNVRPDRILLSCRRATAVLI